MFVGQQEISSIVPLESDGVTPTPGAVMSGAVYTSSNPSVATVDKDGVVSGLAPGTAAITMSCTVTDENTAVSMLSTSSNVIVEAVPIVPPAPLTKSVVLIFGAPTAPPAN